MNGFISRMIDRHLNPVHNVLPRVAGRFEPDASFSMSDPAPHAFEKEIEVIDIGKERVNDTKEQASDHNRSKSPKINLKHEDRTAAIPFIERVGQSDLIVNKETRPDDKAEKKFVADPFNKPENNNDTENPVMPYISAGFPGKEGKKAEFQSGDNSLPDEAEKVSDNHGKKSSADSEIEFKKQTQEFLVKPANSEHGITDSPDNPGALFKTTAINQGRFRTPPWMGDSKETVSHDSEMKVSHRNSGQTVRVNIGRIEVRAIMQQTSSTPVLRDQPKPKSSLDDYLNKHKGHNK